MMSFGEIRALEPLKLASNGYLSPHNFSEENLLETLKLESRSSMITTLEAPGF